MKSEPETTTGPAPQMLFGRFLFFTTLQFAASVLLFKLTAPNLFGKEVGHPWAILGLGVVFGVPLSLFEYLYHRYLLHSAILPFLRSMHRAHALHHRLTYVKAPVLPTKPEQLAPVSSEYSVEYPHQTEAMEFPPYALAIFLAVFTVLLGIPVKLLLPGSPAILAVFCAVTVYYSSYELWHAVLHLPFDRFWKPAMHKPRTGRIVRRVYAFHLVHHWRPSANLAIVGLWGVAVWDYALRTHRRPPRIPLRGASVTYRDGHLKRPFWPVSQLDSWQGSLYRWSRNVETRCAATFLRRKPQSVGSTPVNDEASSDKAPE